MPPFQVDVRQNRGGVLSKHSHSPAIWYDCPWESINNGEVGGVTHFNDFDSLPLAGTLTTQIAYDRYKIFATSAGTIAPSLTAHSASLAQAYGSYKTSGDKTTSNKLWFECRLAVSTSGIVTNRLGWMVGLAEVDLWTLATGVPFSSNTGAAITNSAAFVGFNHASADTTQIHTAYSDRATSFTEVGTNQGVLAANTFTNLGFIYDPFYSDNTKRIRFFQDNVELTTGVTQTLLTGFTNLNANSLGLIFASVGGSATSSDSAYLQWWRSAQLAVS
jgi:hypothetical protein